MQTKHSESSNCAKRNLLMTTVVFALTLMASASLACHKSASEQYHDVAVNSPATGTVHRILVGEGADVDKDAVIVEITVKPDTANAKQEAIQPQQSRASREAKSNLDAAEDEARRTTADVKRIELLVRQGLASKAELDKARALALDASQRVEIAKAKVTSTEAEQKQPPSAASAEQIVSVKVPGAGIVRALNVQEGQSVVAGQQVAIVASQITRS